MNYSLSWDRLPVEARLGQAYNERVRLFRADKTAKLLAAFQDGILSSALEVGNNNQIIEFGIYCEGDDYHKAREIMNEHCSGTLQKDVYTTPFVSATPFLGIAKHYSLNPDEAIIEFEVPVNRVIVPPMFRVPGNIPDEVLVVGGVLASEIVQLHSVNASGLEK